MGKPQRRLEADLETIETIETVAEPAVEVQEAVRDAIPQTISVIDAIERRQHGLQVNGLHAQYALAADVAVAAGALKQKLAAARGNVGGDLAVLFDRLYAIL